MTNSRLGPEGVWAHEVHRAGFQRLLGAQVEEAPGWIRVAHPALRWPLFNYLVPLHPPGPAEVEEAARWLRERDRLPTFWVTPAAGEWRPAPPAQPVERQVVLELPLPPPGRKEAPRLTPGPLRIWSLPPGAEGEWADWLLTVLGVPEPLRPGLRAAYAGMRGRLAPGEQLRCYLAAWDDQPVATGLLFVDAAGQAGLYGAAVLPAYRRRGVAGALTRRRLNDAQQLGGRMALVQAAAGGGIAALWAGLGAQCRYEAGVYTLRAGGAAGG